LVQVPSEFASAHDWQAPVQAEVQQKPWAQVRPVRHSAEVTQAWPAGLRPHDPLMHTAGEVQSALVTQEFLQTPVPQPYGKQEEAGGVLHLPAPSQVEAPVNVDVPPGQLEGMHWVCATYSWQLPLPSHLPFDWQEVDPLSWQMPAGSTWPTGTLVHVPSEPWSAQDWQAPLQAELQQ
jgi:hypothetical protein